MSYEQRRERPKYPQPPTIRAHMFDTGNHSLNERLVIVLHARAKYNAKYRSSKQSKRNPN